MKLLLLCALLPGAALAQPSQAILPGLVAGGALYTGGGAPSSLHLNLGLDLAWLHQSGALARARVESDERVRPTLSVLGGLVGDGLLDNQGLPIGLLAGASMGWREEGVVRAGGRVQLLLSLYYARATLELDLGASMQLGAPGAPLELIAGLSLHLAPWGAWKL